MSSSRLARYFKGSRDNWKTKALEKQKKLRVNEPKIRDLDKSREHWKSKAKKAEKRVKQLERELRKLKDIETSSSDLMPQADVHSIHQRLKPKLSWLINYEDPLIRWEIMVILTRTLETQLKIYGLNQQSLEKFENQINSISIPPSLSSFKAKITEYISKEISQLKNGKTVLGTTDVLESIFGKYKHFSSRCPLKDLRQMLLTIPLSTMTFTNDVIKNALEIIRGIDLEEWLHQVFGQSMLSKRKTLFSAAPCDMKSV